MYRVCGLRLGVKFEMRPAADKSLYLWSAIEKIRAFTAFGMKYLRRYGRSSTNFTAAAKCTNQVKC